MNLAFEKAEPSSVIIRVLALKGWILADWIVRNARAFYTWRSFRSSPQPTPNYSRSGMDQPDLAERTYPSRIRRLPAYVQIFIRLAADQVGQYTVMEIDYAAEIPLHNQQYLIGISQRVLFAISHQS